MIQVRPRLTLREVSPRRVTAGILAHERPQHVVGTVNIPQRVRSEHGAQVIPVLRLEEEEPEVSFLGLYVVVRH